MIALEVQGLSKRYGDTVVVDGVSFAVSAGTITALVGHNGSGKTTVLKMIMGLARPTSGLVRILGRPRQYEHQEGWLTDKIGFVPDTVIHEDGLTPVEFLQTLCEIQGAACDNVAQILDKVGLGKAERQRIGEFSRGMRQRLNIAQALIHDPQVLLLDEPLTGIDPESQGLVSELLLLMRDSGKALLMSSHSEATLEISDRTLLLQGGRVVENFAKERGLSVYILRCSDMVKAREVLQRVPGVSMVNPKDDFIGIRLEDAKDCRLGILRALSEAEIDVISFSPQTLNEFVGEPTAP